MPDWWRKLRAAAAFLTRFPVGGAGVEEKDLAGGLAFFPAVGLCLGALAAGCLIVAEHLFAPSLAALLVVAFLALATGGFHLDGLADTADGLGSSRSRQQMLAIMRDSHIGVMGVLAIVVVLAVKVTALAAAPPDRRLAAVLLMPTVGRTAILLMMRLLPYARKEGRAAVFYQRPPSTALAAALLGLAVLGPGVGGMAGGVVVVAGMLFVAGFAAYCRRMLGGATGDTLGAACEMTEALVALVMAARI